MATINLKTLDSRLATLKSRHAQGQGQLELLKAQLREKKAGLEAAASDVLLWQQVQLLLGKASEYARSQLKLRIEQTVTAALAAIFVDSTMRFEIEMKDLGGKPAADWRVVSCYGSAGSAESAGSSGNIVASPEDAKGGGVTDIVSLALRLALLELSRPRVEGPVIPDEPAKMVSAEYLPGLAEFLKSYAAKTGRQILMVTHHEALADVADVGYVVRQKDGKSGVSRA